MSERLFKTNILDFQRQKLQEAAARAEAILERDLLNPALPGMLDAIAQGFGFTVAKLQPEGRKGKRRKEHRDTGDSGADHAIEVSLIDVTIPMEGHPNSLTIAPARANLIETPAAKIPGALLVTFDDDDDLDRNVDSFITQVSENLDRLRGEMETFKAQVRNAIGTITDRRVAQLRAQHERDRKRSFPIE